MDLWRNETDGISATEMKCAEIYLWGNGSGTLGAANFSTVTATLSVTTNIVYFDLGMRLGASSDATLSPTARSGFITVTGIDRNAGTLTAATNWTTTISGLTNGDYLVRAGDAASGATAAVVTGVGQYIVGGASPGTLFGLSRNSDSTRLAGQTYNATNVPMEDAIIEAESLVTLQGQMGEKVFWCNPRDLAQMRKSLGGKVMYPRVNMDSTIAGVSFKAIEVEGDSGVMKVMTSPFIPRYAPFLLDMNSFAIESLGPAPHMLDYDGPNFLRVASDDAYEVRFGMYWQLGCNMPVGSISVTNWGN